MSIDEWWNRFALSFQNRPFNKKLTTGRIHYSMFDVGRSMFDVRVSRRHTALSLNIQTVRFK
ncbi:hypothetical protein D1AOALGA4SA_135, partial [Olavius algarvensis Delta 1 endosymbiont]